MYALIGLLVPIAIHLWNRKKGIIIKIGSIKLLTESTTNKMSSLKISELILMFLRLGLIFVLVLLISEWYYVKNTSPNKKTVVLIDAEYQGKLALGEVIDSLDEQYDVRYFERTFPRYQTNYTQEVSTDYWTLINELYHLSADSIIIYAPLKLKNFQSQNVALPKHATWVSLPEDKQTTFIKGAYWESLDSLRLIVESNYSNRTELETHTISTKEEFLAGEKVTTNITDSTIWLLNTPNNKVDIIPVPSFTIGIYTTEEYKGDRLYLEAAFSTLEQYAVAKFDLQKYKKGVVYDMIIWLSDEGYALQDETQIILQWREDQDSKRLIGKEEEGRYVINHRTNPYFSSERLLLKLPEELLLILNEELTKKSIKNDNDNRLIDINQLYASSPSTGFSTDREDRHSENEMDNWLWIIFFVLFFVERSFSLIKNN